MNWKVYGKKRPWSNLRCYTGIYLEALGESTKELTQFSIFPGRELNPRPPEYKEGMTSTRL